MARENEADFRPLAAPSLQTAVQSGTATGVVVHKWVVNVTATGTLSIRTLDGNANSMGSIPVGLFQFDIQGDMATWGGTMTVTGYYHSK